MEKSTSSLNNLYKLVAREISGQASKKDTERVEAWKNSSLEASGDYDDLKVIWEKRYFSKEDLELVSQKEANEKIWESVFGEDEKKKKFRSIDKPIFIKVAAALIILFSFAFVVAFLVDDTSPVEIPAITIIHKHTLPGQKSTIPLPDGSIVYLNSGSRISYKSNFNDSIRYIELEGQAFFDVFKNRDKPFIVKCRRLEVEALGTSFDVNGLESVQVSLLTGSVKLHLPDSPESKSLILNPGEYSIVDKGNKLINKGIFNPYEVLAWKEGRLIFKGASLQEIIPKLEMWYGVKIDNQTNMLSNKHFNSTFERENLDNILHNMGLSMGFTHKIHENNVTLINKMPM